MAERLIPGAGYIGETSNAQRLIPGIGYVEESATGAAQTVSPSLLTNSQTFYAPSVSVAGGTQTVTPALLTNTQTFYDPTIRAAIVISDSYERSSVNVSQSSAYGSGDSSVITLKPRYQESEIVSGTRWWEISARIDGILGTRPTFTILDYQSGKLFGHPWTSSHRCHFSYDRETWYPFDTQTLDNVGYTASFRHNTAFTGNTVYFSNNPQFSVHQIGEWIAGLDATYASIAPTTTALAFTPTSAVSDYTAQSFIADEFSTQTDELSRTIPKTPIFAFEINDTSLMPADGSAKRVAILMGGVHAAEDIANHCLKAFIDALLGSSAQAQNLRRRYRILVYPLINAPGRAGGGWRGSFTQGYSGYDDANRHFTSALSELEIVNKPKAAITTDRAGVAPDWAIDFHSQADSTWAMYVPGATESTFYTRQASNAGVTISDMGGDWATAMNSVDTYIHGLGAKLSITSELGDATYVSMSSIASYNAAIVTTLSSMLDDGQFGLFPALLTNEQTFYAPTITGGAMVVNPALLVNDQTFYAPTITQGGGAQTVNPALLTNSQAFYAPTVSLTSGPQTIFPQRLTNTQTFYAPALSDGTAPTYTRSPTGSGYRREMQNTIRPKQRNTTRH